MAERRVSTISSFFTFVGMLRGINFHVGRPSVKFPALCTQNYVHLLTRFKILQSCGAEFHTVGKMHFHSDLQQSFARVVLHSTGEGVARCTVLQDESGSPSDYVMGSLQGQQISGFLLTPFSDAGVFLPLTLGTRPTFVFAIRVFHNHATAKHTCPQQDGHCQSGEVPPPRVTI